MPWPCRRFQPYNANDSPVRIRASLEVDLTTDTERVCKTILQQIDHYFSPPVRFYSLQERLDKGESVDEIFAGPQLTQGFIDSAELQANRRRTELRASDLIRLFMDVEGVRTVKQLEFLEGGKWLLKLDHKAIPKLDQPRLFYQRGSQITLITGDDDNLKTEQFGVQLSFTDDSQATNSGLSPKPNEFPPIAAQDRQIGAPYYSIQHQFPDTYGINSNGLPASASPRRQAQAKQLKAYLLLFDQILANYFAQLANVGRLFSITPADPDTATYFSQILDDPSLGLDEDAPNALGLWTAPDKDDRRTRLDNYVNTAVNHIERKNRFLTHLLARFAEQLPDHLQQHTLGQRIRYKQAYLQQYADLSQRRSTRAALEQRIRLKLGLDKTADLYLVEHILLRPIPEDKVPEDKGQTAPILKLRDDIPNGDPYSLRISVVLPNDLSIMLSIDLEDLQASICAEIPAHLNIDFLLLDAQSLQDFKAVYQHWQQIISDSSAHHHQVVRAARDRLIDLLGFGCTYPLSDLVVSAERVPYNEKANIRISNSQSDVIYQLYDEKGIAVLCEEGTTCHVIGNGKEAQLTTPPIDEDKTYRILACKRLTDNDICTDTHPYRVYLQQPAKFRVGLNTHLEAEIIQETDAEGNNLQPSVTLLISPIGSIDPTAARLIYFEHRVEVEIRNTQEGVKYRLFSTKDGTEATALSSAVTGLGGGNPISILSQAVTEDTNIYIQVTEKPLTGDSDNQKSAWLDTELPLKVRANTNLLVAATPNPIVAYAANPIIRLQATQASAHYRAFCHSLEDNEFVFGNGSGDLLSIPVPDYPDEPVQVISPAWQAIWQGIPTGYTTTTGTGAQGNGGELDLVLMDPLTEDSLIILQAEKQHQTGNTHIPSAVQLHQPIVLLAQPDPTPALFLRIFVTAGEAHAIQVANGQTGVFYHFRLATDGEDISLPAYFHQWATNETQTDKGIGRLRIERDFVIATTTSPKTPVLELTTPLPAEATLYISARKARTNVAIELANTVSLPAIPVIQAPQTVVAGDTASIQIQSTKEVHYQLWQAEQLVAEADGDGNLLELTTAAMSENTTFMLRSIHDVAGGMHVEFEQTILIQVVSS
ncbi:MAG: hypothetical protein HC877_09435 [Thioploca sp.]|nr:hypothetical protein [Thioploca sp.]